MSDNLERNLQALCSDIASKILANTNSSDSDKERHDYVKGSLLFLAHAITEAAVKLISVKDEMPPDGQYVLTRRKSGYTGAEYEFITAKYMKDYKGWTTIGNDRLTESGENPTHWRHFIEGEMQAQDIPKSEKPVDTIYNF